MSESIRRKSSSRQLLQNLIRVTAQRSQEDAEEVERERRRRSREKERGEGSPSWPEPPQHRDPTHNIELEQEVKASSCLTLEEDEGFSDWTHRLENRNEPEAADDCGARVQRPPTQQWKPEPGGQKWQQEDEDEGRRGRSQGDSTKPPQKMSSSRKEARTSFSSSVFLPQDARLQHAAGQPADRTSYLAAGTMKPRGGPCRVDGEVEQKVLKQWENQSQEEGEEEDEAQLEEVQAALLTEMNIAETHQSPRDEEDEEEEELRFTHEEKEELHLRREERHREVEKEVEEEEGEHKVLEKRLTEDRRSEEVSERSTASRSSSEGDESMNCYGPMSPTFKKLLIQFYPDEVNSRVSSDGKCKIIERTESLRKSTNNVKKTPPPVAVSKIDKKLEQYTHALKASSKEARSSSQVLTELTSPTEPVSSKKNLFEAGEAWNQNAVSVTPSKDADGLRVGVADLINQWVRGSEDGSRCSSPFKPADGSPGKKYKFVVTGHGKYEKVSVGNSGSEDAECPQAGQFFEEL